MKFDFEFKPETLEEKKQPNFIFDIKPGLEVREGRIVEDVMAISESVFSKGQMKILNNILDAEIAKKNAEIQNIERENLLLLEQEKQKSWQEGYDAGIKQTHNEYQDKVIEYKEQLEHFMKNIQMSSEQFAKYYEEEIMKMIMKICRKILDIEISMDKTIIVNSLRNSLELINEKQDLRIFVNPEEWSIVDETIKKFSQTIDMPENVIIIPDENITIGGCKIEFKSGSIDSDIESQFAEIKRKMLK